MITPARAARTGVYQWQADIHGVATLWMVVAEGSLKGLADGKPLSGGERRRIGLFGPMDRRWIPQHRPYPVAITPARPGWFKGDHGHFSPGGNNDPYRHGGSARMFSIRSALISTSIGP